jgi:uncharacterized membrane protein
MKDNIVSFLTDIEHIVVAVAFGIVNLLLRPARGKLSLYLLEFFISVAVAALIGMACLDFGLSKGVTLIAVACSALVAKDILTFIVGLGDYVEENKEALYKSIFKSLFKKADRS